MHRNYQFDFSSKMPSMYDTPSRELKAKTMIAVLSDFFAGEHHLGDRTVLDVGASTGIIDHYLSGYFKKVSGVDIDAQAVSHAKSLYDKDNLEFFEGDAMNLQFTDSSFDIVICSQVYEHVPDSQRLINEIHRVLKPYGVCYFSAGNRLNVMEPHYRLPLLSVLPKVLAHIYLRLAGKGSHYYEEHLGYWGLRNLTRVFVCHDYTKKMVNNPAKFEMGYLLNSESVTGRLAKLCVNHFYWAFPNYIWLLQKPGTASNPETHPLQDRV